MKKVIAIVSGVLATFAVPLVSFAVTDVKSVGVLIISTINTVIVPVLFAVAFLVFLWGAFDVFILGSNDEEVKDKGKNLMLWGLIGFFVMVSVWGLVNILTTTTAISNTTQQTPPTAVTIP